MRFEERWQWWIRAPLKDNPKRHRSRWHMSEAEALRRDPQATRVEGTRQVIEIAETNEEIAARSHSVGSNGVTGTGSLNGGRRL
jgi:hypothetical protein